jgi:hypothetical protein
MTQRKWVESKLLQYGEISRNLCLVHFISRLSAIIQDLEADGWEFTTSKRNGDYVYSLVSKPKRYRWEVEIRGGVAYPRKVAV